MLRSEITALGGLGLPTIFKSINLLPVLSPSSFLFLRSAIASFSYYLLLFFFSPFLFHFCSFLLLMSSLLVLHSPSFLNHISLFFFIRSFPYPILPLFLSSPLLLSIFSFPSSNFSLSSSFCLLPPFFSFLYLFLFYFIPFFLFFFLLFYFFLNIFLPLPGFFLCHFCPLPPLPCLLRLPPTLPLLFNQYFFFSSLLLLLLLLLLLFFFFFSYSPFISHFFFRRLSPRSPLYNGIPLFLSHSSRTLWNTTSKREGDKDIYINIYIYIYKLICMYIYIERER